MPLLISQRGLSGSQIAPTTNSSEGAVTAVNIHRQPNWQFQLCRSRSSPVGTFRAISRFTNCAARMPTTIVNWLIATSRPRMWAGATSAMYIGERLEAMPMATPPTIRQSTKAANVYAQPVRIDETANRRAAASSSLLRPSLSLSPPVTSDPSRQPTRAQLLAQPTSPSVSSWKYFSKNGLAPPITTQS